MYLSLNWLKDYLDIPKNITPEIIAEKLTMHTVEVEKTFPLAQSLDNVIVGKVLEVSKHENADKLKVTIVDCGDEKRQIVCGAPNVEPNIFVAVALPGAILPSGMEIKVAEVRGVKSTGMICAADELGIGVDHEGIMILNSKKAKVGQAFSEYLELDDIIFEIDNKSLSHRPDLFGHLGISRELAAALNLKTKKVKIEEIIVGTEKLDIKIEDKKLCPVYSAIKITNIEIDESPNWLKNRLQAVGLKPINNIVDITNYIMFDLGQPLHAFDASKVKKVRVRLAKEGEKLMCLDNKERELKNTNLMIADGKNPIAIAGIVGGTNYSINNDTKEIIIESANFNAQSIRKTSTNLNIRTDASTRYEKGQDPENCLLALKKAVQLIKKVMPKASVASEIFIEDNLEKTPRTITLESSYLNESMGMEMDFKVATKTLENLGFQVDKNNVIVPSFRMKDIINKEDLLEEVVRIYGFDNIPATLPKLELSLPIENINFKIEDQIKELLAKDAKMTEVYNYSFVSEEALRKLEIDASNYIRLANPLNESQALLRQSLLPGLINNLNQNQRKADTLKFFEIGNVFFPLQDEDNLPYQEKKVALGISGNNAMAEIKGILKLLFKNNELSFLPAENKPEKYGEIIVNHKKIGIIQNIENKTEIALAEMSLLEIVNILMSSPIQHEEQSKYPTLERDLAFVVDEKILYNDLYEQIKDFHPLITKIELFDVYSGRNLSDHKKSLAFHISYRSNDKTLTAKEVDEIQKELINKLAERFDAQIRDF